MITRKEIEKTVFDIVGDTEIIDVHTHLFPEQFGKLALWGPDELITYHYLVAEAVRATNIKYEEFWIKSKREQADFIFKSLFIDRSPVSEACRGVLTTFNELGIELGPGSLDDARIFCNKNSLSEYIDIVFDKGNIKKVVMTNDPFDINESKIWDKTFKPDSRFIAALRLDTLLNDYKAARYQLIDMGYEVGRRLNGIAKKEIKRFLKDKIKQMKAVYLAVSLPPDFNISNNETRSIILEECVLPVAYEMDKPLAMMIGIKRLVNPDLRLAGDSVGKGNIETVEYLCKKFNRNKFMITMLSRENQHELCVAARKFSNLYLFGCWWFLNNPALIKEITRMRMELLGTSFLPQHSDARVLDQLMYKWKHSKKIIAEVLVEKYEDLYETGWPLEEEDIKRDIKSLFGGSFDDFLKLKL